MAVLLHLLVFCALLGLAWAAALILPEATAWPQSAVTVVSLVILAGGILAQTLVAARRQERRLDSLEDSLARLSARTEALESAQRSGESDGPRSQEMLQEMRVLQTLLGQIVSRGGETPSPGARNVPVEAANDGEQPQTAEESDIPEDKPLAPEELSGILRGALSENRVDLYLQPTVALPSRRTVHYECFSRVRGEDGQVIYPKDYLPVAASAGLTGTLDNLLLFRCIQLVRKLGPRRPDTRFFCNISSASLHDEDFFPQFVEYMIGNAELAERLVFEFAHDDLESLGEEERQRLASLGRAGYQFSIDHVASRQLDARGLAERSVGFVKIDLDTLLRREGEPSARQLRDRLGRRGITLIASKVEDEGEVLDLLDLEAELAQGYLFGEPRLSREEPQAAAEAGGQYR